MSDKKTKLSREDVAKIEVGHTDLSRSMAWTLSLVFLLIIFMVPVIQGIREKGALKCLDISQAPGNAGEAFSKSDGSLFRRIMVGNRSLLVDIQTYEANLEDDSFLTKTLVPPVQFLMAKNLGAGNEKAYIGRDRWLFYRPSLDYLTGPGFMDPSRLARRAATGSEWSPAPQPDPRKAILEFRDQLAERNIALILVPTPAKPGVHPEQLSGRYDNTGDNELLHNVSYNDFIENLRSENVLICELGEVLKQEQYRYLATDTHWRPETMEAAARYLADFINENVTLPEVPASGYKQIEESITSYGDVTQMMKMPEGQTYFKPETVNIQQIVNDTGDEFWRSNASADVLLLGDSFSNIYSLDSMGWGSSAGMAEQLSFILQRPLDTIVRNDEAAHATRGALDRDLMRGKDRLEGKKVVIWQFAERELALGDWKHFEMQLGEARPSQFVVPSEGTKMIVTGVVEAVSSVPRPGSVVYPDHIFSIHLSQLHDEDGKEIPDGEAVVFLFSMRDQIPTEGSQLRPGRKVKMSLQSWSEMEAEYGGIRRSELEDDELMFEDPCWGEIITPED